MEPKPTKIQMAIDQAKLTAAAPEMLERLMSLRKHLEYLDGIEQLPDVLHADKIKIYELIKKITE